MQSIFQSLKPVFFVLVLGVLFSCKKDDTSKPTKPTSTTVTDIDGNTYNTVTIGNQVWMKENLKVSKYRNGDSLISIKYGLSDSIWAITTNGAYAINYNDPAMNTIYGKLYNWYAVADSRCLCPVGWHVPSDAEWSTLENFLGGDSLAGGKMKEVSPLWASPNTGATNSSGFSALPGGLRVFFGRLYFEGRYGYWWSSTENSSTDAFGRFLSYESGFFFRNPDPKESGFSVRCLKD